MGQALITRRGVPMLAPDVDDGYEQLINYTMLYDSGDECEEVTGGWDASYNRRDTARTGSVIKNADNLQATKAPNGTNGFIANNTVNIYGHNRAFVVVKGGSTNSYSINFLWLTKHNPQTVSSVEALFNFDTTNKVYENKTMLTKSISPADISYYVVLFTNAVEATGIANIYNVGFVKPDDINTLCSKAGIDIPSSLESLIADTTSLATIFNNEDAVKFMVAQCTGDFMVSVLSNEAAVEALKASPYLNLVVANPHWAKFAMMIPTGKSIFGFTMLYDEGDECTDVTGGWTSSGWSETGLTVTSIKKNAGNILSASTNSKVCLGGTVNAVDVSESSMLCDFGMPIAYYDGNAGYCGLSDKKNIANNTILTSSGGLYAAWFSATRSDLNVKYMATRDISEVDGEAYLCLYSSSGTSPYRQFYSYAIFVVKADDYQILCSKAGITAPSDIATLVADSTAMATITSNEEAVKYLMGCTGDLMVSILTSSVAVGAIVNSAYATEMLTSHPAWAKFIKMSPVCADAGLDLLV